MRLKFNYWCICLILTLPATIAVGQSSYVKPVYDSVYYHLRVDTLSSSGEAIHAGYLRQTVGSSGYLTVGERNGDDDYALWRINRAVTGDSCRFYNKGSGKVLKLTFPTEATDTIAYITASGTKEYWYNLAFYEDSLYRFITTDSFNLRLRNDSVVMLSAKTSAAFKAVLFTPERIKDAPLQGVYYQLHIDTVGAPDIYTPSYLAADTSGIADSLTMTQTMNELAHWTFEFDTLIRDTSYYHIINKGFGERVAFTPSQTSDTVAYISSGGALDLWTFTFYAEDGKAGRLHLRDTVNGADYWLAFRDSALTLVRDTVGSLRFVLHEENDIPPILHEKVYLDSNSVYRVKLLSGADSGKYYGSSYLGTKLYMDTVYAHIPDGQFVVYAKDHNILVNRGYAMINTGALYTVHIRPEYIAVPDVYTNLTDTFRIDSITYGDIDTLKKKPDLGYKEFSPSLLSDSSIVLRYVSSDASDSMKFGYEPVSLQAKLTHSVDTNFVRFIPEHYLTLSDQCAPATGKIAALRRHVYRLRSLEDSTLYLSSSSDTLSMERQEHIANFNLSFSLKEDTARGTYYIIPNHNIPSAMLVDATTQRIYSAPYDTVVRSVFSIETGTREIYMRRDTTHYLSLEPAMYEISVTTDGGRWLTKNEAGRAVLRREGESMLKAGTVTAADLQLRIDTSDITGTTQPRRSYFIVYKPVTSPSLSGWFLRVSSSLHPSDGTVGNCFDFAEASRSTAEVRQRLYLQYSDTPNRYYLTTEEGLGAAGAADRGYLSVTPDGELYAGAFDPNTVCKLIIKTGPVHNKPVVRPKQEAEEPQLAIIGGEGVVQVLNAAGQKLTLYNVLGQQTVSTVIASESETIAAPRGVAIVKLGETVTRKIIIR